MYHGEPIEDEARTRHMYAEKRGYGDHNAEEKEAYKRQRCQDTWPTEPR